MPEARLKLVYAANDCAPPTEDPGYTARVSPCSTKPSARVFVSLRPEISRKSSVIIRVRTNFLKRIFASREFFKLLPTQNTETDYGEYIKNSYKNRFHWIRDAPDSNSKSRLASIRAWIRDVDSRSANKFRVRLRVKGEKG